MFFSKLFGASLAEPRYIRRTRAYLQEARMAMLEHTIAAEYYQSSADMYAERAARLEEELRAWEEGVQQSRAAHGARRGHARHPKPATVEPATAPAAPSAPTVGMVRAA
ncbi:Uncharacterised protein [Delftia tsuruhatensis]|uniref:hypothetical protein n=1 Tax=Delftia tsuruhatensis TaxID=180282 RepID=UPI001E704042|nr:hypothetical protein [Delftia tsuruhatensis]CAB5721757.1 Uncharacterised protein [Delftia tsuruhatensis]CAC9680426.1 Uncharacterised protein [Delftia tsuruhatensis]